MAYRYKRGQLFAKKLDVPKFIQNQIYNNALTLADYIRYDLDGKIPTSCLTDKHKAIVELYGYEKIRKIDLELLDKNYIPAFRDVYEHLLFADPIPEDVNEYLYEILGKVVEPSSYTEGMKIRFKDRLFTEEEMKSSEYSLAMDAFNRGSLSLDVMLDNWDLFKYKDIDYVISKEVYCVRNGITAKNVRDFMSKYAPIYEMVSSHVDIYSTIRNLTSDELENNTEIIKNLMQGIMDNSKKYGREITNEEYRIIFEYIDMEEYLKDIAPYYYEEVMKELKQYDKDYIYTLHIPMSVLFDNKVLSFVRIYGIKNVVDFDKNCGGIFSKNNYALLYNMYDLYMHYAGNDHNPETTFFTKKAWDENGNYIDRGYTKYEFFEAIKRMLKKGPSDWYLKDKCPNFIDLTGEFRDVYKELFISDDAPLELKDLFYTKELLTTHLAEHPEWAEYLRGKSCEVSFKPKEVIVGYGNYPHLLDHLISVYGHDDTMKFAIDYAEIIELVFSSHVLNENYRFDFDNDFKKFKSMDEIKKFFNKLMILCVEKLDKKIPKNVPLETRVTYPNLFLDDNVPDEIKDAYYNREMTPEFIVKHPNIIDYFGNTNIGYGFTKEFKWLLEISTNNGVKQGNLDRLKILDFYNKIDDKDLQNTFVEFVKDNLDLVIDRLELVSDILCRLSFSNSPEIYQFRTALAKQLLELDNPMEGLEKIENIFIKNNLPVFVKLYEVFNLLHPGCYGFDFGETSRVSPVLKNATVNDREDIIFSDLLKSSLLSNNRSLNDFINLIEIGNAIYESGIINEDELSVAIRFRDVLISLYERKGQEFKVSEDILDDLNKLNELFSNGTDLSLEDKVISSIAHRIGFDTLADLKAYRDEHLKESDRIHDEMITYYEDRSVGQPFRLEVGDFVKGIGDINYLRNILQNGSVSKEYLGVSATSDFTPLDTDLSRFTKSSYSVRDMIEQSAANSYGSILFILKNRDGRFNFTRTHENVGEEALLDDKLEVFYTGGIDTDNTKHYGIRTGFASSEIDAIILKEMDKRVFLEIAMNGIYLPVFDLDGKLIFSKKDYLDLRSKMSGLSYYDNSEYIFGDDLEIPDALDIATSLERSEFDTKYKRDKVLGVIKSALDEMGLKLKTSIDFDLTEGSVELIDTGSTGRGTNKPGDGDFDFMMRVDRVLLNNEEKMNELRSKILNKLGQANGNVISSGDFRLKDVVIDDVIVDIDITFTEKTDKVTYSTDMCLVDRLSNIRKQDPEKYKLVVANIILAKQVLKEAGCYKPNRGEVPQGGLGGVGIENWILQNGGSFMNAIDNFLHFANGLSFEEFRSRYQINDFGENHLAQRRGNYRHDNFVNNMSEEGYKKMVEALNMYQYEVKYGQNKTSSLN